MENTGWVCLWRKIQDKGWYKNAKYVQLWVHILIKANHKPNEFMWNKEIIIIKEGQFITGRKKLASETGLNESTIEKILKVFEKEHQIEQQKTTKFRLITVINWKEYQEKEQQSNNRVTTKEQQSNTNNNDNNDNKVIVSEQSSPSVQEMMKIFYEINPTLNFGNKTIRKSAQNLIDKLGEEKALASARAAVTIYGKPYAPTITTPSQLENKLSELVAFYKKTQSKVVTL